MAGTVVEGFLVQPLRMPQGTRMCTAGGAILGPGATGGKDFWKRKYSLCLNTTILTVTV